MEQEENREGGKVIPLPPEIFRAKKAREEARENTPAAAPEKKAIPFFNRHDVFAKIVFVAFLVSTRLCFSPPSPRS